MVAVGKILLESSDESGYSGVEVSAEVTGCTVDGMVARIE